MIPVVDDRKNDTWVADMDPGKTFMYEGDIFYRPVFSNNIMLQAAQMKENIDLLPVIYLELGSIVLLPYDAKVEPVDVEIHLV